MSEQNLNGRDNEIDLFDLVDDIREKWLWVFGFFVAGLMVALAYALMATPVYRTEAIVSDAPASDLVAFNQPALKTTLVFKAGKEGQSSNLRDKNDAVLSDEPVFALDSETAFSGARTVIRSSSVRKAFYSELLARDNAELRSLIWKDTLTEEQNLAEFLEKFSFTDPAANDRLDIYMRISFELAESPQLATNLLNDYLSFALAEYDRQIRSEMQRKVDAQLQLNRSWAESLRAAYRSEKERQIVLLNEAAEIAASIGQKMPFYASSEFVVSGELPLYMMGEKALRKEMEQLKSRSMLQSEDLFIQGLPQILQNTAILESVSVDWSNVRYALIDQPALLPRKAAKPKRLFVLGFGGVGGLMLGLLAALLAAASSRHVVRERR